MAIQQTEGTAELQRLMDSGNYGNRSELMDWIVSEADEGRLNFSQNDLYNFFRRPEEDRKRAASEANLMGLIGEARAAGEQGSAHLARRLGFGGTALGGRIGDISTAGEAAEISRAINKARGDTAKNIMGSDRLGNINLISDAFESGASRRAQQVAEGGTLTGTLAGAIPSTIATIAAAANPIGFITAPAAAAIGAGLTAIGGATGTAAGQAAKADYIEDAARKVRQYRGKPVQFAEYTPTKTSLAGSSFAPVGSNERSLAGAFGQIDEDEANPFLFGSNLG